MYMHASWCGLLLEVQTSRRPREDVAAVVLVRARGGALVLVLADVAQDLGLVGEDPLVAEQLLEARRDALIPFYLAARRPPAALLGVEVRAADAAVS